MAQMIKQSACYRIVTSWIIHELSTIVVPIIAASHDYLLTRKYSMKKSLSFKYINGYPRIVDVSSTSASQVHMNLKRLKTTSPSSHLPLWHRNRKMPHRTTTAYLTSRTFLIFIPSLRSEQTKQEPTFRSPRGFVDVRKHPRKNRSR